MRLCAYHNRATPQAKKSMSEMGVWARLAKKSGDSAVVIFPMYLRRSHETVPPTESRNFDCWFDVSRRTSEGSEGTFGPVAPLFSTSYPAGVWNSLASETRAPGAEDCCFARGLLGIKRGSKLSKTSSRIVFPCFFRSHPTTVKSELYPKCKMDFSDIWFSNSLPPLLATSTSPIGY